MSDEIIATLPASPPRRWLAVIMLACLGGVLTYVAFTSPAGAAQIFFLVIGLAAFWATGRLHRSTQTVLELTRSELRVQNGSVLAPIKEIQRVERGPFAFKPTNGFSLIMRQGGHRGWVPGIYWASGRRIGVGGVTGAPQAKYMSEAIATVLAEHAQGASET